MLECIAAFSSVATPEKVPVGVRFTSTMMVSSNAVAGGTTRPREAPMWSSARTWMAYSPAGTLSNTKRPRASVSVTRRPVSSLVAFACVSSLPASSGCSFRRRAVAGIPCVIASMETTAPPTGVREPSRTAPATTACELPWSWSSGS